MTAAERARWLLTARGFTVRECLKNHGDEGVAAWVEAITEAIVAAEDEALERAAEAVITLACKGMCEHPYCVAAYDARSMVLALKSSKGGGR